MDYKGYNDRDEDEQDPNNPFQTETTRKIKRIFKIALYSVSFIVYALIFFVIFTSCEPGMFNKMYFTEQTRSKAQQNPDSFRVFKIQPSDFMNFDGSVELAHIYYAEDTDELEVGVKYNLNKITDGKVENALVFVLADSNGNYYSAVNQVYDSNRKYGYARVAFSGVKFNLKENSYIKYIESYDISSAKNEASNYNFKTSSTSSENSEDPKKDGVNYYLYIYSYDRIMSKPYASKDNKGNVVIDFAAFKDDMPGELTKNTIYNNGTVISSEKYKYD